MTYDRSGALVLIADVCLPAENSMSQRNPRLTERSAAEN